MSTYWDLRVYPLDFLSATQTFMTIYLAEFSGILNLYYFLRMVLISLIEDNLSRLFRISMMAVFIFALNSSVVGAIPADELSES